HSRVWKVTKKSSKNTSPNEEVRRPHSGPQRAFSVLDRLLLTHPVWLQLSLNRDSALYILLREPVGVRGADLPSKPPTSTHITSTPMTSTPPTSTPITSTSPTSTPPPPHPSPQHLSPPHPSPPHPSPPHPSPPHPSPPHPSPPTPTPITPTPITLPEVIARATSHRQLEAISHMGQGRARERLLSSLICHYFARSVEPTSTQHVSHPVCSLPGTQLPQSQQALQTLQALQTQQQQSSHGGASTKRLRFKRSMRVRLSTDGSMHLSMEGGGSSPVPPQQEPSVEAAVLGLDAVPTPSLAELDSSSSFSSLDEEPDQDASPPADDASASLEGFLLPPSASTSSSPSLLQAAAPHRPPLMRSGCRGGLQRMSAAFVCFFAPEKRVTRLVEELSRDRRSAFGELRRLGLRLFLTQAKSCLLDSGELEPPIQTLVPETPHVYRKHKSVSSVLRPLKKLLDNTLVALHRLDGSSQRLAQDLLRVKGGGLERLGIRAPSGAAYDREVERVRQKLGMMQRSHSPIDKVLLLLQACKCVHKAMGSLHRQEVSWEDFLPSLTHVIVECNRPHILLEVEYMMELLEPSWLCGEGGYYLSSVYASLCLIQSLEAKAPRPPGCLTREAQEELREWGRRRGREAQIHRESQRIQVGGPCFLVSKVVPYKGRGPFHKVSSSSSSFSFSLFLSRPLFISLSLSLSLIKKKYITHARKSNQSLK
uniref:Si:ch211-168d1.3 n=1 Tax=Gadus morhua TaxID=8049 RepID=A0A8C5BNN4_GADMO